MSKQKTLGTGLENRVVQKATEKGLEARKQPGSGVFRDFPNDCVVERTLVECKVRTIEVDAKGNSTFRVDVRWLQGAQRAAEKAGFKSAALVMNAKGSQKPMVLIDLDQYLELLRVKKT